MAAIEREAAWAAWGAAAKRPRHAAARPATARVVRPAPASPRALHARRPSTAREMRQSAVGAAAVGAGAGVVVTTQRPSSAVVAPTAAELAGERRRKGEEHAAAQAHRIRSQAPRVERRISPVRWVHEDVPISEVCECWGCQNRPRAGNVTKVLLSPPAPAPPAPPPAPKPKIRPHSAVATPKPRPHSAMSVPRPAPRLVSGGGDRRQQAFSPMPWRCSFSPTPFTPPVSPAHALHPSAAAAVKGVGAPISPRAGADGHRAGSAGSMRMPHRLIVGQFEK